MKNVAIFFYPVALEVTQGGVVEWHTGVREIGHLPIKYFRLVIHASGGKDF